MADGPVPYARAAQELLHTTLLDAMGEQLATRKWTAVTMAEVARAAGVSRQTLYKAFGSRQEFARAYVLRQVDRFLEGVQAAVRAHPAEPVRGLTAAFAGFLTAAGDDPLVREIVSSDGGAELLPLVTTQGRPVVEHATERLAFVLRDAWPAIAPPQARLVADCVVRLAISHAALPGGAPGEGAESVATLLGPYVERVVG